VILAGLVLAVEFTVPCAVMLPVVATAPAFIASVVVMVVPLSVKDESVAVLLVVRLRITLAVAVPTVWITVAGSCAIEAEPPI